MFSLSYLSIKGNHDKLKDIMGQHDLLIYMIYSSGSNISITHASIGSNYNWGVFSSIDYCHMSLEDPCDPNSTLFFVWTKESLELDDYAICKQ